LLRETRNLLVTRRFVELRSLPFELPLSWENN